MTTQARTVRTVLVTGASRIGRALALSLAQPGWDVGQIAVTQAVLSRIRSARRRIVFTPSRLAAYATRSAPA